MDQTGVRIAVPRGDVSELYLSRILKRAELVRTDTMAAALDLLRTGRADARAAPRLVLLEGSAQLPGSRVLEGRFGVISFAALVPKGHAGRLAYVSEFIEEVRLGIGETGNRARRLTRGPGSTRRKSKRKVEGWHLNLFHGNKRREEERRKSLILRIWKDRQYTDK